MCRIVLFENGFDIVNLSREKLNNRFVKKTLPLPAWLAARGDNCAVNYSKLFQNALIDYLKIEVTQKIK